MHKRQRDRADRGLHKIIQEEEDEQEARNIEFTLKLRQYFIPSLTAEFIGTFLRIFTAALLQFTCGPGWAPMALGFVMVGMIYTFGPISGGTFNTAVALCLGILKYMSWLRVLCYAIVQVTAAFAAALLVKLIASDGDGTIHFGYTAPYSLAGAATLEILYTGFLTFTVINVTEAKRNNPDGDNNHFFALAIGAVTVCGGYAVVPICGAYFNPAASLALGLTSGQPNAWMGILYAIFECIGAVLGAGLYYVIRPEEHVGFFEERVTLDADSEEAKKEKKELADFVHPIQCRCCAEMIGSFYLVLTIGLAITIQAPSVALTAFTTLMPLVYALGDVSGGHLNPAVTICVLLSGQHKKDSSKAVACLNSIFYILAQLVGATIAAMVIQHFHAVGPLKGVGTGPGPLAPYTWPAALGVEVIFTFLLGMAVLALATADDRDSDDYDPDGPEHEVIRYNPEGKNKMVVYKDTNMKFAHGLGIGGALCAGGIAVGGVSGGVFNPALAFGLSIESSIAVGAPNFLNCLAYGGMEICGAALASLTFLFTHPHVFTFWPPPAEYTHYHAS